MLQINRLYLAWGALDLCLLAAGLSSIAYVANCNGGDDVIRSMAITRADKSGRYSMLILCRCSSFLIVLGYCFLVAGTLAGVSLMAAFLLSLAAVFQPVHRNKLLISFNWALIGCASISVAVCEKTSFRCDRIGKILR